MPNYPVTDVPDTDQEWALWGSTMPVEISREELIYAELVARVPFIQLDPPDGGTVSIPGADFQRLFSCCYKVLEPQGELIMWGTSWRPESLARVFLALVESGLPRIPCSDVSEFLNMTKDHLRRQIRSGNAATFTMDALDVFYHQLEPENANNIPIIRIPEFLNVFWADMLDKDGIPVAAAIYYGMGPPFTRMSRAVGSEWQQTWHALKFGLVGTAIQAGTPDSMVANPIMDLLRTITGMWCGNMFRWKTKPGGFVYLIQQMALAIMGTDESCTAFAQAQFLEVLSTRKISIGEDQSTRFGLKYPRSLSVFARDDTSSYDSYQHFKRLLAAMDEPESTFIPSLERVEATLSELASGVLGDAHEERPIGQLVHMIIEAIRAHKNAAAPGQGAVSGAMAGNGTSLYKQGSAKAVEKAMLERSFIEMARAIESIMGDGIEDPYWMHKAFKLIMVREDMEPHHPLVVQQIWGSSSKLSSGHHKVFAIVNEIKKLRSLLVSQYFLFGDSMGEHAAKHENKSFLLGKDFLDNLFKGTWENWHLLDDLLVPLHNAKVRVGQRLPTKKVVWLTQEHIPKLRLALQRLERLTSCSALDSDLSAGALMESMQLILERGDALGDFGPMARDFQASAQQIFNDAIRSAGRHLVSRLGSDDSGVTLHTTFMAPTEIEVFSRMEELNQAGETFVELTNSLPSITGILSGQAATTQGSAAIAANHSGNRSMLPPFPPDSESDTPCSHGALHGHHIDWGINLHRKMCD